MLLGVMKLNEANIQLSNQMITRKVIQAPFNKPALNVLVFILVNRIDKSSIKTIFATAMKSMPGSAVMQPAASKE